VCQETIDKPIGVQFRPNDLNEVRARRLKLLLPVQSPFRVDAADHGE
jgi:hypothetical protein